MTDGHSSNRRDVGCSVNTIDWSQHAIDNSQNSIDSAQDAIDSHSSARRDVGCSVNTIDWSQNVTDNSQDAIDNPQNAMDSSQDAIDGHSSTRRDVGCSVNTIDWSQNAIDNSQDAIECSHDVIVCSQNTIDEDEVQMDMRAERIIYCDLLQQLIDFAEDTVNLKLPVNDDPDLQNKYVEVIEACQDQGAKIFNRSPEQHERIKLALKDIVPDFWVLPKEKSEDFDEPVIRSARQDAKQFLAKLKLTEGNYDFTDVKLSRTENVAPEQKMYGKKVRRKFQGQRQIAMEVKSHGIVTKEFEDKFILETNKQFVILSGVAGSGKSAIFRELAYEFFLLKELRVFGLNKHKLMVQYECRNVNVSNYEQLIEFNFPGACRDLTVEHVSKIVSKMSVLYVVDGYDEVNSASEFVLKEILKCIRTSDRRVRSSALFGTRPHAVQSLIDFLKSCKVTDNEIDTVRVVY